MKKNGAPLVITLASRNGEAAEKAEGNHKRIRRAKPNAAAWLAAPKQRSPELNSASVVRVPHGDGVMPPNSFIERLVGFGGQKRRVL
ncbi:MAG: hypothetical protein U1F77_12685 [Kiritimatiellia bacterium]